MRKRLNGSKDAAAPAQIQPGIAIDANTAA